MGVGSDICGQLVDQSIPKSLNLKELINTPSSN